MPKAMSAHSYTVAQLLHTAGTYITRSDVLRGQSWAMNAADSSRSTRGGTISHAATYRAKALDSKSDKCVALAASCHARYCARCCSPMHK